MHLDEGQGVLQALTVAVRLGLAAGEGGEGDGARAGDAPGEGTEGGAPAGGGVDGLGDHGILASWASGPLPASRG